MFQKTTAAYEHQTMNSRHDNRINIHQLRQLWNLSFDGVTPNVKDLIFRIESLAVDDNVPIS